jgi:dephospho-CoA kinase
MKKIGLTGGIATGKSHVLERLQERGIPCLDSDELAHGVIGPGTEATAAIEARFGSGVIAADGAVDRATLGPIVFADPRARRDLEAIIHPAVYRAITAGVRAFELVGTYRFVVVDVPLLYETGHAADFDAVIVTACSPAAQIDRMMKRGLSEEAAQQRLSAQLPTADKIARAQFVIRTDGSFEETDRQIDDVVSVLSSQF